VDENQVGLLAEDVVFLDAIQDSTDTITSMTLIPDSQVRLY
jgi:hypothetical protein